MSETVCATCRLELRPEEANRSVCFRCFPQGSDEAIGISGRVSWWMRVAEAKQDERDVALARVKELEEAVQTSLNQLDQLAEIWGDEGVFRWCRDRLRSALAKAREA